MKQVQCDKCGNLFIDSPQDSEMCHICRIADLETKLAESESELEKQKEKYDKLYGCYKKTSSEDLQDKYRLAEENEQLKQQLAEKDKEISNLKGLVNERDKQIKNLKTNKKRVIEHKNNVKISFAVEQLEKLRKHYCHLMWDGRSASDSWVIQECVDLLDKELKQLTR